MATALMEDGNSTSSNNETSKIVQLSNLEAFIKRTLGGTGEGLPIETLANTIVNKFYGSQLFSDNAGKQKEKKWKVGMQVLMFSKSKDRWIRGFVRCLETEGYVTVAYGNRVKTVHPDSESIKPADVPNESEDKSTEWRTSEEAKLEVFQTSSQSFIPNIDKVKSGDQNEPIIDIIHEFREKQLKEIMLVLEKELESDKKELAPSDVSVPNDSSLSLLATRVRANSCPNQVRDKLVSSLKRIRKPIIGLLDEKNARNFGIEYDKEPHLSQKHSATNHGCGTEVKSLIVIPIDEDSISGNESKFRDDKLNKDTEASLDSRWERYDTMSQQDFVAKVLVIGDVCAGKTSVIHKYVSKKFSNDRNMTIGIDFATKRVRVGNSALQIVFWDIAGQERFIGLAPTYYRNADAVLIVLDATTKMQHLDTTAKWKAEVDDKVFYRNGDSVPVLLFANKWDLMEERENITSSNTILDNFSRKHNFDGWFRTSAKTGHNISKGMNFMINKILENKHEQEEANELESRTSECIVQLSPCQPNSNKGSRCCGL